MTLWDWPLWSTRTEAVGPLSAMAEEPEPPPLDEPGPLPGTEAEKVVRTQKTLTKILRDSGWRSESGNATAHVNDHGGMTLVPYSLLQQFPGTLMMSSTDTQSLARWLKKMFLSPEGDPGSGAEGYRTLHSVQDTVDTRAWYSPRRRSPTAE